MLFVTNYTLKPHLTKSDSKALMDEFGKRGGAPGEVAHYVRIDGSGGVTITDNEDAATLYAYVLPFAEYMDFDVCPALKIDDAVGPILSWLGG
jgi:hypothetical protein